MYSNTQRKVVIIFSSFYTHILAILRHFKGYDKLQYWLQNPRLTNCIMYIPNGNDGKDNKVDLHVSI